MMDIILDDDII